MWEQRGAGRAFGEPCPSRSAHAGPSAGHTSSLSARAAWTPPQAQSASSLELPSPTPSSSEPEGQSQENKRQASWRASQRR